MLVLRRSAYLFAAGGALALLGACTERTAEPRGANSGAVDSVREADVAGADVSGVGDLADSDEQQGPAPAPPPSDLPAYFAADPRIRDLPFDCHQIDPYARDTADVLSILSDKLDHGDADVMGRACEELGALGDVALPLLRRRLAADMNDPQRVYVLHNTLRALSHNPSDGATDALVLALTHPTQPIRSQVLGILARRTLPERHFGTLLDSAFFEPGSSQTNALLALFACDPVRAAGHVLDWYAEGRALAEPRTLGVQFARLADPEVLTRLRTATLPAELAPFVDAALRAAGDEEAEVRTALRLFEGDPLVRAATLEALIAVRAFDLVDGVAASDPAHEMRALACRELAKFLGDPDPSTAELVRERLLAALDDGAEDVRLVALRALVEAREPAALDRAIDLVRGTRRDMEQVLLPLHTAMSADPELAERVRTVIAAELANAESRDPARDLHLLQALGLCPGRDSANTLIDQALGAPAGMLLEGIRAHRYLAIQCANTGAEGRAALAERLALETEPVRRLDLVWAIGAQRDDLARNFLTDLVENDAIDPWERVFALELLCKIGPTERIAPIAKAAARRLSGGPRRAAECLLYHWY
jgi:hypothetical protein